MVENPTPYDDINGLIAQLLSEVRQIFGDRLAGFYLFGSLVTGDFDRGSSDIDLVAVTSTEIDEKEFEALRRMHEDFAVKNREWEGRIEVAYLSAAALKAFKDRRHRMAIISPGEPFHVIEAGKDWLMNWYTVREKGVVLLGPSPAALIPPISKEEYVQAVKEYALLYHERIHRLPVHRPSQAYAILSMCRVLYTSRTGEQVSKKQAALWAMKEFPQWAALIQQALVWRDEWRDEQVDHAAALPQTQQFIRFVVDP
ncbi:hypothetical protein KDAU_46220 [Dictyobacter aurantiacus]|uniref:Adenylyltransferase AadA C-terminal domain-containing protein n=2 Tax=Dictyobacter aurantiacus TaxID=1936993 RepID=A0A401ZKB5_9CHLR|nr:hypothetical protein KDAU_46220 [Dictyobacter aurantiacus]